MTEVAWKREYLFTAKCSSASSGCGFMQDVTPPQHTHRHTQTSSHLSHLHPHTTIPRFDQGWEVCYWGGGVWAWRAALCERSGLDTASRELTQHAFLPGPARPGLAWPGPAWPGPQMVSMSTQVTKLKQCETFGLHHGAKNAFSCCKI